MGMKVNGTTGLTFPDTTTLGSAGQSSVQAWVNFNGTGTVAIRANFNVSSITDNGTGDYTVNFANALVDANYCVNATSGQSGGSGTASSVARVANTTTPITTTSCQVMSLDPPQNNLVDVSIFAVSFFR